MRQLAVFVVAAALFHMLTGFQSIRISVTQFPWVVALLGAATVRHTRRPELWIAGALVLAVAATLSGIYVESGFFTEALGLSLEPWRVIHGIEGG